MLLHLPVRADDQTCTWVVVDQSSLLSWCRCWPLPRQRTSFHHWFASTHAALGRDQVGQFSSCLAPDKSEEQVIARRLPKNVKATATTKRAGTFVIGHISVGVFKQLVPGLHFHLLFPALDEHRDELRVRTEVGTVQL